MSPLLATAAVRRAGASRHGRACPCCLDTGPRSDTVRTLARAQRRRERHTFRAESAAAVSEYLRTR